MIERRDLVIQALKKVGIQHPTDDQVDSVSARLDSFPNHNTPSEDQADQAVALFQAGK